METIWKFPLKIVDTQVVKMPLGAEILSAQIQGKDLCVWARVNDGNTQPSTNVKFYVYGTGHRVTSPSAKYLDTFQMHGGAFIFHVFWEKVSDKGEPNER